MIGIIDYGMGNLGSVKRKLDRIKADSFISSNPLELKKVDKFILPGVGHFARAVKQLKSSGLWELLFEEVIHNKKPVLGICLGMQLMAKHSEEGDVEGLGWFDADVVKFSVSNQLKNKIPHMGWNNVIIEKNSTLLQGSPQEAMFYFVHSYHINCYKKEDILTTTEYDYPFTSSIQKNNIFGTQFHPEKSHEWGEHIFRNFSNL
jgi:imidazole glycerol-phosphate synthase subunit HisH